MPLPMMILRPVPRPRVSKFVRVILSLYAPVTRRRCLAKGDWSGYAGGDAPGLAFETAHWIRETDIAAICADTWGCEVRPNETDEANQPWHWVVIPAIGISMGEIFYVKELAEDCAEDGVYEFFFVGARPCICQVGPVLRSTLRQSNSLETNFQSDQVS